jgi:hypothetical protein
VLNRKVDVVWSVESASTIAAYLSYISHFATPFAKRNKLINVRGLIVDNSDQFTVLKACKRWLNVCPEAS